MHRSGLHVNQHNLRGGGIRHRRPQERAPGALMVPGRLRRLVPAHRVGFLRLSFFPSLPHPFSCQRPPSTSFWCPALQQCLLQMLCVWQAFRGREIRKGEERHWPRHVKAPCHAESALTTENPAPGAFPASAGLLFPQQPLPFQFPITSLLTSPFTAPDVVS